MVKLAVGSSCDVRSVLPGEPAALERAAILSLQHPEAQRADARPALAVIGADTGLTDLVLAQRREREHAAPGRCSMR